MTIIFFLLAQIMSIIVFLLAQIMSIIVIPCLMEGHCRNVAHIIISYILYNYFEVDFQPYKFSWLIGFHYKYYYKYNVQVK